MSQDICEVLLTAIDILDERRAQISAVDDFTTFDNIEEEKAVAVASNPFGDILLQEQMQIESGTIELANNSAQTFTWPVNGIDKGYDRLAISIKAWVEAKGSGNYGMRFTFIAANKDLSAVFDSSEFLGTPWTVGFDMLQKKLFDLSSLINIQRIVVEFYNNSDTAVTFKEVSAILGYDLMNYSEKTSPLTLYVEGVENSELKYVTNAEGRLNATMSPDKIMINARWIYKNGDSARAITAANPGDLPEGAFIRWYKYCEEAPRGDQYGGSYYGLITNPNNNPFVFQLNSSEFLTSADKTQIKAVIVYGEETYTSNLVVIRNDKSKSDEFFQNRGITLEDGSSGIYAYYDFDNNIKEDFALETAVDRVAKVTYKKNFEGDAAGKVSKTIWKIPSGLLTHSGGSSSTFTEDGYDILEANEYVESITYRIKDAIPQTASVYKIICIMYGLDGVQYTFEKEVSLILASNSGNPVIIRLLEKEEGEEDKYKVVHAAETGKTYTISASIYNEKGEKIAPIYNEKEERIDSISINYAPVAGINELSGNTIIITDAISSTGAIIKATFQLSERNRVEEYFTIPVTNDVEYWYKGPKSIVYASTGCDPIYGTGECYLYKNGTIVEGITWGISTYQEDQSNLYIPVIGGNILTPKNSYDSSMDKGYYLTASKDNTVIWIQPIAVYINPYFSRIINEWDGSFKIDEKGNYILASAYVAGSKEDDGTFTGAILGELGTIADKTNKSSANTGLFGYKGGVQSFGLRADGTAFFGSPGGGRITIDGAKSEIYSENYKESDGSQGTYLDLATGKFITNDGVFRGKLIVGGSDSYYEDENGNQIRNPYTTDTYYMKNNSSTVAPNENDSQWTTDASTITVNKGEYLWTKIVHRYYSDPKTEVQILRLTGDVGNTGSQGPQGPQGPQGGQGPAGENGENGTNNIVEQVTVYYSVSKTDTTTTYNPQNYPTPGNSWSSSFNTGSSGNNAWANWVWSSQKTTITQTDGTNSSSSSVYTAPKLENSETEIVQWCVLNGTTITNGSTITTGKIIADSLQGKTLQSLNYASGNDGFASAGSFYNLNDGSISAKNFKIDSSGNATFRGTITATAGSFGNISLQNNILTMGGFTITSNGLSIKSLGDNDHMYFGSTGVSYSIAGVNRNDWRFVVGKTFGISASGAVAATNIKIQGASDHESIIGPLKVADTYIAASYDGTNSGPYITASEICAGPWKFDSSNNCLTGYFTYKNAQNTGVGDSVINYRSGRNTGPYYVRLYPNKVTITYRIPNPENIATTQDVTISKTWVDIING